MKDGYVMTQEGSLPDREVRYAVGMFLSLEDVAKGWPAFAILDSALWEGARRLGWTGVGRWELKLTEYDLLMDGWRVRFQVWLPKEAGTSPVA